MSDRHSYLTGRYLIVDEVVEFRMSSGERRARLLLAAVAGLAFLYGGIVGDARILFFLLPAAGTALEAWRGVVVVPSEPTEIIIQHALLRVVVERSSVFELVSPMRGGAKMRGRKGSALQVWRLPFAGKSSVVDALARSLGVPVARS